MAASLGFTTALLTACALGLVFRNPRWGIGAAAALSFLYPALSIAVLMLGLAILIIKRKH